MKRTLFALLAVAASLVLTFALIGFDHRAISWNRFTMAAFALALLLPGLIALASRRWQSAGVAYTSGFSLVAGLALALPAGVSVLFISFSSDREEEWQKLLFAAFTFDLLILASVGLIAFWRLPPTERRFGVLFVSMVCVSLYLALAWQGLKNIRPENRYDRDALVMRYNDRQARQRVAAIVACAKGAGRNHAAPPLPSACGFSRQDTQSPSLGQFAFADGYEFFLFADPFTGDGHAGQFVVCARPGDPGRSGSLLIGVDTQGVTRELTFPDMSRPPCFSVWSDTDDVSFLRAFSGCVLSATNLRGQRGYPPAMFPGGIPAGACDMDIVEQATGGRMLTDHGVLEYLPEFPDRYGRISGYSALLFSKGNGSAISIDQQGHVRNRLYPGIAPTLEAVEAARRAATVKADRLAARRTLWAQQCESGDLELCESLGNFEWANSEPKTAQRWWDHACEQGRLTSCLLSSRYNPMANNGAGIRGMERCYDGEPSYCKRLEQLADSMRSKIEQLRARGGHPTATVRFNLAKPGQP